MKLVAVSIFIAILNLPFGYWRSSVKRFSLAWFAAIHIPVPFVVALRLGLFGWDYKVVAVFVAAYAVGQFGGARARSLLTNGTERPLSSSLVRDAYRYWRQRRNPQDIA